MEKIKKYMSENPVSFALFCLIAILGALFFVVAASDTFAGFLGNALGTDPKGEYARYVAGKQETLKFIGWAMSGLLAAIVALAINRRTDEMAKTNVLTEKGHIEDRFKNATNNLASAASSVRISSFYQFYYLAKDNPNKDFRKNIFDILCAHVRNTTRAKKYQKETGKVQPTEEIQSLLDVLFQPDDKTVFAGFQANLKHVYLVNAIMRDAHMHNPDFSWAYLQYSDFRGAKLGNPLLCYVHHVHETMFGNAEINWENTMSRIPHGKGEYWTSTDQEGSKPNVRNYNALDYNAWDPRPEEVPYP